MIYDWRLCLVACSELWRRKPNILYCIVLYCANVPLHDLISDVEIKSSGDDVDGIDLSSLSTSSAVTTAKFDIDCLFVCLFGV